MKFPIHIVLENIRSAFNVGAIFRTSDAASVEKLWLTGITPYPPHNRIPKTALGAQESVPWEYNKDTIGVINSLKAQGITPIAAELTPTSVIYTDYKFPRPVVLVFGNEITGVSKEALDLCEKSVEIPMYGQKESLNVEVSYGILVYEVIRQYNNAN